MSIKKCNSASQMDKNLSFLKIAKATRETKVEISDRGCNIHDSQREETPVLRYHFLHRFPSVLSVINMLIDLWTV